MKYHEPFLMESNNPAFLICLQQQINIQSINSLLPGKSNLLGQIWYLFYSLVLTTCNKALKK